MFRFLQKTKKQLPASQPFTNFIFTGICNLRTCPILQVIGYVSLRNPYNVFLW